MKERGVAVGISDGQDRHPHSLRRAEGPAVTDTGAGFDFPQAGDGGFQRGNRPDIRPGTHMAGGGISRKNRPAAHHVKMGLRIFLNPPRIADMPDAGGNFARGQAPSRAAVKRSSCRRQYSSAPSEPSSDEEKWLKVPVILRPGRRAGHRHAVKLLRGAAVEAGAGHAGYPA